MKQGQGRIWVTMTKQKQMKERKETCLWYVRSGLLFSRCTLEIDADDKRWLDESLTESQVRYANSEYLSFIFCPSIHIEI